MNIIVVGGGSVGAALSARLQSEGHDITVIDVSAATLSELAGIIKAKKINL